MMYFRFETITDIDLMFTDNQAFLHQVKNELFSNEEIIETAKKKMKEIFGASKDYEFLDWSMPR